MKGNAQNSVAIAYDTTKDDRFIKWRHIKDRILWAMLRLDSIDLNQAEVSGLVESS